MNLTIKIATIAIKLKTLELDKPGLIAALVDAHERKQREMNYG